MKNSFSRLVDDGTYIWLIDRNHNLAKVEIATGTRIPFDMSVIPNTPPGNVEAIARLGSDDVLIGTYDSGIGRIDINDETNNAFFTKKNSQLSSDNVVALAAFRRRIWVAYAGSDTLDCFTYNSANDTIKAVQHKVPPFPCDLLSFQYDELYAASNLLVMRLSNLLFFTDMKGSPWASIEIPNMGGSNPYPI